MPQGLWRLALGIERVDEGLPRVGPKMGISIFRFQEVLRTPPPRLRMLGQVVVDSIPCQCRPMLDIQDANHFAV